MNIALSSFSTCGFKLELRHDLAEVARPIVKILQSRSVEQVGTEITLHRVKFCHTVRHRRACGYTLPTQRTPMQSQSIMNLRRLFDISYDTANFLDVLITFWSINRNS